MTSPLVVPERNGFTLPAWMLTHEQIRERERILRGRFFLVRTAGLGERWRCRNCGGHHRYLTDLCVERPWNGLTQGLYAYVKTIGAFGAERYLDPAARARVGMIRHMLGSVGDAPDLASSHPRLAQSLGTATRDADLAAFTFTATEPSEVALGLVEPISREKAARLVARINARGRKPALILEGLRDGE